MSLHVLSKKVVACFGQFLHALTRFEQKSSRPIFGLFFKHVIGGKVLLAEHKTADFLQRPMGSTNRPRIFGRQLIIMIINYKQPWTTLGLAPRPQRENRDPNGSQRFANFQCIMVPGSPWSARRSLLRLQSAILMSLSNACDFAEGPRHRGAVSGSKTSTK